MKIKLLIFITILIQLSCQQKYRDLEQSWLLLEKEITQMPENTFLPVYKGSLYHFDGEKCSISSTIEQEIHKINYTIEDNYIKADSGFFGQIQHLSKESLVLNEESDLVYNLHFLPLENTKFTENDKSKIYNQLLSNSWSINDTALQEKSKLFFNEVHNDIYRFRNNKEIKYLVTEREHENHKYLSNYSSEWWILKSFKGKLILCYSHGQTNVNYFQITDYSENKINGKVLHHYDDKWRATTMTKSQSIESDAFAKLKKSIVGHWEIQRLNSPSREKIDYYKKDGKHHTFRSINRYENQITITDLEEQNLRFSFHENGEHQIFAHNKLIRKGTNWGITNDGSYIYLDEKLFGGDFIQIQSFENEKLGVKFNKNISFPIKHGDEFISFKLEMFLRKVKNIE